MANNLGNEMENDMGRLTLATDKPDGQDHPEQDQISPTYLPPAIIRSTWPTQSSIQSEIEAAIPAARPVPVTPPSLRAASPETRPPTNPPNAPTAPTPTPTPTPPLRHLKVIRHNLKVILECVDVIDGMWSAEILRQESPALARIWGLAVRGIAESAEEGIEVVEEGLREMGITGMSSSCGLG